jgi:hypothetical protein
VPKVPLTHIKSATRRNLMQFYCPGLTIPRVHFVQYKKKSYRVLFAHTLLRQIKCGRCVCDSWVLLRGYFEGGLPRRIYLKSCSPGVCMCYEGGWPAHESRRVLYLGSWARHLLTVDRITNDCPKPVASSSNRERERAACGMLCALAVFMCVFVCAPCVCIALCNLFYISKRAVAAAVSECCAPLYLCIFAKPSFLLFAFCCRSFILTPSSWFCCVRIPFLKKRRRRIAQCTSGGFGIWQNLRIKLGQKSNVKTLELPSEIR